MRFRQVRRQNIIDPFRDDGIQFKIDRDHLYHLRPADISYTIYY